MSLVCNLVTGLLPYERKPLYINRIVVALILAVSLFVVRRGFCRSAGEISTSILRKMSLEQLMNLEVTSVTDPANKLLVLIDGRSVYPPLYSGVFRNVQDYLMHDIASSVRER
ncbi:MAG: hypothetical protein M1339_03560 [Bacteroidetes bacterium]|nr:hypothetical protein [Bacteroidota bacterium]